MLPSLGSNHRVFHKLNEQLCHSLQDISIVSVTWNVNGKFETQENLERLIHANLPLDRRPDIIVINIQEVIELSAQSVVSNEIMLAGNTTTEKCNKWQEAVLWALNHDFHFYDELASMNLVGLWMGVYYLTDLEDHIYDIQTAQCARGLMGTKGALYVHFRIQDTSICLINSHLSAHREKVYQRNADYHAIMSKKLFHSNDLLTNSEVTQLTLKLSEAMRDVKMRLHGDRDYYEAEKLRQKLKSSRKAINDLSRHLRSSTNNARDRSQWHSSGRYSGSKGADDLADYDDDVDVDDVDEEEYTGNTDSALGKGDNSPNHRRKPRASEATPSHHHSSSSGSSSRGGGMRASTGTSSSSPTRKTPSSHKSRQISGQSTLPHDYSDGSDNEQHTHSNSTSSFSSKQPPSINLTSTSETSLLYSADDHDVIIFSGDMNYRLVPEIDIATAYTHIDEISLCPRLQFFDQLNIERKHGRVFRGFIEPDINFLPTYQFICGTNQYDRRPDKKMRCPAWCDRILYRVGRLQELHNPYNNNSSNNSSSNSNSQREESGYGQAMTDLESTLSGESKEKQHGDTTQSSDRGFTLQHSYENVEWIQYTSLPEFIISDHQPVRGCFRVSVKKMDYAIKELLMMETMESEFGSLSRSLSTWAAPVDTPAVVDIATDVSSIPWEVLRSDEKIVNSLMLDEHCESVTGGAVYSIYNNPAVEISPKYATLIPASSLKSKATITISNFEDIEVYFRVEEATVPAWLSVSFMDGILRPRSKLDIDITWIELRPSEPTIRESVKSWGVDAHVIQNELAKRTSNLLRSDMDTSLSTIVEIKLFHMSRLVDSCDDLWETKKSIILPVLAVS